eukprot:3418340-Pleurochrysis_carterae.AAC.1
MTPKLCVQRCTRTRDFAGLFGPHQTERGLLNFRTREETRYASDEYSARFFGEIYRSIVVSASWPDTARHRRLPTSCPHANAFVAGYSGEHQLIPDYSLNASQQRAEFFSEVRTFSGPSQGVCCSNCRQVVATVVCRIRMTLHSSLHKPATLVVVATFMKSALEAF